MTSLYIYPLLISVDMYFTLFNLWQGTPAGVVLVKSYMIGCCFSPMVTLQYCISTQDRLVRLSLSLPPIAWYVIHNRILRGRPGAGIRMAHAYTEPMQRYRCYDCPFSAMHSGATVALFNPVWLLDPRPCSDALVTSSVTLQGLDACASISAFCWGFPHLTRHYQSLAVTTLTSWRHTRRRPSIGIQEDQHGCHSRYGIRLGSRDAHTLISRYVLGARSKKWRSEWETSDVSLFTRNTCLTLSLRGIPPLTRVPSCLLHHFVPIKLVFLHRSIWFGDFIWSPSTSSLTISTPLLKIEA